MAVDKATLSKGAIDYRHDLQTRQDNRFLIAARQLYDWLIAPIEEKLKASGVDTLVMVPEGSLRTVPLAALHDGDAFLIERYALATTPALGLYPPEPVEWGGRKVLVGGLSDSVQGFSPLPGVPSELTAVAEVAGGDKLLNENYVLSKLSDRLGRFPHEAIHLATHAQFTGDPAGNYVLTYDSKLTLDGLRQLIGSVAGRNQPLELLSLSACQSALGDEGAALGLAGTAVKVGARAALGTLWFVDDEATSRAMTEFYRELFSSRRPSKAKALQAVQRRMIAEKRFWHPSYWAPFLLIGNWM